MKCYEFRNGKLVSGIKVTEHLHLGQGVQVGNFDTARGSKFEFIRRDKKNPARIINGVIYNAYPNIVRSKASEHSFIVMEQDISHNPLKSKKCLIKVCTATDSKISTYGSWLPKSEKEISIVAEGRIVKKEEGTVMSDDLLILEDGDAIQICPEGEENVFEVFNQNGELKLLDLLEEALRSKALVS